MLFYENYMLKESLNKDLNKIFLEFIHLNILCDYKEINSEIIMCNAIMSSLKNVYIHIKKPMDFSIFLNKEAFLLINISHYTNMQFFLNRFEKFYGKHEICWNTKDFKEDFYFMVQ
jgi:hypothetical protein